MALHFYIYEPVEEEIGIKEIIIYYSFFFFYSLKIKRLKITQLVKMCFVELNELKFTQNELFSLFHFKSVTTNISELFCVARKQIMNPFITNLTFQFKLQILYICKLASLR